MTAADWARAGIALLSTLVPILVALLFRLTIKATHLTDQVEAIGKDLVKLVEDKDKVHNEMLTQMREDRRATDRRLRWLEEHQWRRETWQP